MPRGLCYMHGNLFDIKTTLFHYFVIEILDNNLLSRIGKNTFVSMINIVCHQVAAPFFAVKTQGLVKTLLSLW